MSVCYVVAAMRQELSGDNELKEASCERFLRNVPTTVLAIEQVRSVTEGPPPNRAPYLAGAGTTRR